MSITSEQYEKIVDFLEEKMTPEERRAFLNEVALDQQLLDELEWERVLRGKDDIPVPLTEPDKIKSLRVPPLVMLFQNKWLVAASLLAVVVIGAAAIILLKQKTVRPDIVKDKPRKKYDSASQKIKDNRNNIPSAEIDYQLAYNENFKKIATPEDLPSDLDNVSLAYQQKDYRRVILEATGITSTRGQNKEDKSVKAYAGLFKGVSLMELHETKKAIAAFNGGSVYASPGKLHDDLLWYTALCYLKEGNKEECVKLLNILQANGSKKREASSLLKKLTAGT